MRHINYSSNELHHFLLKVVPKFPGNFFKWKLEKITSQIPLEINLLNDGDDFTSFFLLSKFNA
jgi:hypothetical protein